MRACVCLYVIVRFLADFVLNDDREEEFNMHLLLHKVYNYIRSFIIISKIILMFLRIFRIKYSEMVDK